jgi:hypothetical protein
MAGKACHACSLHSAARLNSGVRGGLDTVPSLKPLKSVAHNLCAQFASTLNYLTDDYGINHLARAARRTGGQICIDLIEGTSQPQLTGLGPELVGQLSSALPGLLLKAGLTPDLLASATANYNFGTTRPDPPGAVAYDCVVTLKTKGDRSYRVELSEHNSRKSPPNNSFKPTPLRSGTRHGRESLPCLAPPLCSAA